MRTFEEYKYIDEEKEKLFLELAHLDELEINFDFIRYKGSLFYYYNDYYLFNQYKIHKEFYISYYRIWTIFESNFKLNTYDIGDVLDDIIEKYFKITGYDIRQHYS